MSITCGFYNSIDHDRKYNAEQLTSLVDGIIRDGVFMGIGDALLVNASNGMNIVVGSGRAWFNSTWTHNDTDFVLTVDQSEMLTNRIDAVVLEVDHTLSVRNNTIKMVKGTPGTVPVAPTLIRTELVNQYALAHVYVGAGVTVISAANITNKVGTGDCPFVTGILQTLNLTALLTQWDGEFHDILNLRDTQFGSFISSSQGAFNVMMTDNQGEFDTMISSNQNEFDTMLSDRDSQFDTMISSNQNEFDTTMSSNQNEFDTMLSDRDSQFDTMISQRDAQFVAWFELIEAALDENVATNLINMINTHKDDNIMHVPHLGTTTNNGNAYTITSVKNIPDKAKFSVKFNAIATGTATLKISSDGTARTLKKPNNTDFKPKAGIYSFIRDGVNFQLLGEGGEYGTASVDKVLVGSTFGTENGVETGAAAPKLSNLFSDGDFEKGIISWTNAVLRDITQHKFGSKSLKISATADKTEVSTWTVSTIPYVQGHKYYVSRWVRSTVAGKYTQVYFPMVTPYPSDRILIDQANVWTFVSGIIYSAEIVSGNYQLRLDNDNGSQVVDMYFDGLMLIDLTDAFGEGKEPDKATIDAIVLSGNLLGKDGDCEDLSNWGSAGVVELSSTINKYGGHSFKHTANNAQIYSRKEVPDIDPNKYYLVSAWVYIESASGGISMQITDTNAWTNGQRVDADISKTNQWQRIGLKIHRGGIRLILGQITVNHTSVSYIDGVLINEISGDEYNNVSIDELFVKYPYTSRMCGWWDSDLELLTSDATAVAGDVLSGKTAYKNGEKITGTIPKKSAATYTPSQSVQTIAAAQYLSGKQTISAVSVDATKVLIGTTIAGKAGTMPNRAGDTAALSVTTSGKTLKLRASNGYRDGVDDYVTHTDANRVASNIKQGVVLDGITGTYKSPSPIFSIQRGSIYASELVVDAPINAVDLNRAIVIAVPVATNYEADTQTSLVSAELTSATNISFKIKTYTSDYVVRVYWTVIEFDNIKSIQRGDRRITGNNTYIDINLVNPDKCMVFCTQRADGTSGLTGSAGMAYMLDSHLEFDSGTRVILHSYCTGSRPKIIHWQIVEFN